MSSAEFLLMLESLPEDLRKKALAYIETLLKHAKEEKAPKKKRPIGLMKGEIHMSDDFDEPLEDMRPYME